MLVSIITVCFNSRDTIAHAIRSVARQSYPHIEHIVIDGGSTDGTVELVREMGGRVAKLVSEPDEGVYDALNKGISIAKGEVVGFLHSDDVFAHERVVERVVRVLEENPDASGVYGDLVYVSGRGDRVIRYWRAGNYALNSFRFGWMPPHPTLFLKKEVFERWGVYRTDYEIAADYEFILRVMWKNSAIVCYLPEVLVKMRIGGKSNRSLKNLIIKSCEDYRAMKEHGIKTPWLTLLLKNLRKAPQFVGKPRIPRFPSTS